MLLLSATTTFADVITSPGGGFMVGLSQLGTVGDVDAGYSTGFLRSGAGGFDVLGTPAQGQFLHREAWGVAAGGASAFIDPARDGASGNLNLLVPLHTTGPNRESVTIQLLNGVGGTPILDVKQDFSFAAENVLKIHVTLTNDTTSPLSNVLFRRLMSWEIPPWNGSPGSGAVDDQVVIPAFASPVVQASAFPNDYSGDPTTTGGFDSPPGGQTVGGNPNGVADLGAVLTLNVGTLAGTNVPNADFTTIDIFEALNTPSQSGDGLVSELNGLGANYVILGSNAFNPAGTNFAALGVQVQEIPEPATLALVGLGLAGLAGWRWRRRSVV